MKTPQWCGPYAFHVITGKSYYECKKILRHSSIGQTGIEGIWIGAMILALKSQGFRLNMMKADGAYTLGSFKDLKGLFLCEIHEHYVVMKNGVMYDSAHPNGSNPSKHRVLRAYEVIKDDNN